MSSNISKSQNRIRLNPNNLKYFKIRNSLLSPRSFYLKLNDIYNNCYHYHSNVKKRNKLNSFSLKNTHYSNHVIFMKREIAFNKSIEDNRNIFKYQNYSLLDNYNKNRIFMNKRNIKKNISENKYSSLYLTESMMKPNNSMLPLINHENSTFFEKDNNNDINNNNTNSKNNNISEYEKNNIFNNYKKYGKKRKKIAIKLINDKYLLKTFDDNFQKNKEEEKILFQKQQIYNHIRNKEFSRTKYMDNIKGYLTSKLSLNLKKEQKRIFNESIQDEIDFLDDRIRTLKNQFNIFQNIFLVKYDEYMKIILNKIKIEKNIDDRLIEYINELNHIIVNLKQKIKKVENTLDIYINCVTILIRIKEKKLVLPNYYETILSNKIKENKNEMKNVSQQEIERILNYKNILIYDDPEQMLKEIKNYENHDLALLKHLNSLRKEIYLLKKEKEIFQHNIDAEELNIFDEIIEPNKNLLLNLKTKNNILIKEKNLLNSSYNNINNLNNNDKHSLLYYKTFKILNNLNKYIKYDFIDIKKINKNDNKQEIILHNLSKIEILVDIFMNKINIFKMNNPNKLNIFKILVDKNNKMRKINDQKKMNELKITLEKNRINEKFSRNVILPSHKINIYNIVSKELNSRKNKVKRKFKAESIEDYLSE